MENRIYKSTYWESKIADRKDILIVILFFSIILPTLGLSSFSFSLFTTYFIMYSEIFFGILILILMIINSRNKKYLIGYRRINKK